MMDEGWFRKGQASLGIALYKCMVGNYRGVSETTLVEVPTCCIGSAGKRLQRDLEVRTVSGQWLRVYLECILVIGLCHVWRLSGSPQKINVSRRAQERVLSRIVKQV